ncbi:MAG: PilZ domain-containing protein, partial [Candidatus Omnitrophica bacterium]|nr:PilZ domain-containing protein [Candidatus Omnitrophota bacterium]
LYTFMKLNLVICDDLCLDIEAWVVWHKAKADFHTYGFYFTRIRDQDKEKLYQFICKNFPNQIYKYLWQGLNKEGGGTMERERFEDRRIFERFEAKIPLRFIDLTGNKEGEASVQDASAKGVGFVCKEQILPQSTIEMWIKVPDKGEPLYARGKVVWSKPADLNKYRVGVNLDRADLMGLSRILRVRYGLNN